MARRMPGPCYSVHSSSSERDHVLYSVSRFVREIDYKVRVVSFHVIKLIIAKLNGKAILSFLLYTF